MNNKIILGAIGVFLWSLGDTILSDRLYCDMGDWEWYVLWMYTIGGTIFMRHALFK